MFYEEVCKHISIELHNIAYCDICGDTKHKNIISPFSRIYYIEAGDGVLQIGKQEIKLTAGKLYLVPGYTFCTYNFNDGLLQYYIHFSNKMDNGLNLFDLFSIKHKVDSSEFDVYMIRRLLSLHPNIELPSTDPGIYQDKTWLGNKINYTSVSQYIETRGIIEQLLSRFLLEERKDSFDKLNLSARIRPILIFIQCNLSNDFSVDQLADMARLSKDHFSRIFKKVTGYPPGEFIIRQRIEKAQYLLLTTNSSHDDICEQSGFKSISYFSRLFSKYTKMPPGKYRRQK